MITGNSMSVLFMRKRIANLEEMCHDPEPLPTDLLSHG